MTLVVEYRQGKCNLHAGFGEEGYHSPKCGIEIIESGFKERFTSVWAWIWMEYWTWGVDLLCSKI